MVIARGLGEVVGRTTAIAVIFVVAAAVLALVVWLGQRRRSAFLHTARRPWVLAGAAVITACYQLAFVPW